MIATIPAALWLNVPVIFSDIAIRVFMGSSKCRGYQYCYHDRRKSSCEFSMGAGRLNPKTYNIPVDGLANARVMRDFKVLCSLLEISSIHICESIISKTRRSQYSFRVAI